MTSSNKSAGDSTAPRAFSLEQLRSLFARNWWIVAMTAGVLGCLGLGVSLIQTPLYQSTATLYVTSGTDANAQSAYQGSLASQQRVTSYAELIGSDAVLRQALDGSGLAMGIDEARQALSASSHPDTVLLDITATNSDPGTATILANSVADSLATYVTTLEQPSAANEPLAKVTVVSPAVQPDSPFSPRVSRNTGLSVVVGIIFGILISVLRERFDTRIRNVEEVLNAAPTTVLAEIPSEDALSSAPVTDFAIGASRAAEGYRRLRTNLAFVRVDHPPHCVLVTSPGPSEGKTTTSLNIAAALAEDGNRVVLVDADLRRPTAARRLGLTEAVGLTNYLRGDGEISDFIQAGPAENLDVLVAGALPPNPAELLGSRRAEEGVERLRSLYDFVIVDSAPVLPVADSAILSQYSDGVLVVVRSGSTRSQDLTSTFEALSAANATTLGVVLNDVSTSHSRYVYYAYDRLTTDKSDGNVGRRSEKIDR